MSMVGGATALDLQAPGVPVLGAIFSSLAAFAAAAVKPPTPLARAIVVVLVVKLLAIISIKLFMFPDNARPVSDANAVTRIVGPTTTMR